VNVIVQVAYSVVLHGDVAVFVDVGEACI